jgi:hypothetical protein
VTSDPIGAALAAEAEEARAEIRAAGLICPSCGVNMADLPKDHRLVLTSEPHPDLHDGLLAAYAQCADGERASLLNAPFEVIQSAANIALMDDFRRREDEAFAQMLGGQL